VSLNCVEGELHLLLSEKGGLVTSLSSMRESIREGGFLPSTFPVRYGSVAPYPSSPPPLSIYVKADFVVGVPFFFVEEVGRVSLFFPPSWLNRPCGAVSTSPIFYAFRSDFLLSLYRDVTIRMVCSLTLSRNDCFSCLVPLSFFLFFFLLLIREREMARDDFAFSFLGEVSQAVAPLFPPSSPD